MEQELRQQYSVFIDENYSKASDFAAMITTEEIQQLSSEGMGKYLSLPDWNSLLTYFEFESAPIKGTAERVWKMKQKE